MPQVRGRMGCAHLCSIVTTLCRQPRSVFATRGGRASASEHGVQFNFWKMVELELGEFLYDLEADPGEQNNLIHKQVERAEAMRLQFEKWQASLPTK